MQILGKRSKILLIAVAIFMLAALGLSFALWDTQAVKASSGDLSQYANAKVGDIIEFGQYYQTLDKDSDGEYIKTPIKWIVVDKNERTGEITLMSEKILATGSYFGNWYHANAIGWGHYDVNLTAGIAYSQAYVESTVRAFLNNLERFDLGGDAFDAEAGYLPSYMNSTLETGLLSSVGFSNQKYWTGLSKSSNANGKSGFVEKYNADELYYQRPINSDEYKKRPASRGFYDEAFTAQEKSMIVPKQIAGYTGYRWPDNVPSDVSAMSYVEGTYDKVWLPSATELNIMNGYDKNKLENDAWTNPSDEASSTVFEYFKHFTTSDSLSAAVMATRTDLVKVPELGNYSLPVYKRTSEINKALEIFDNIGVGNTSDHYWIRSSSSPWCNYVRVVDSSGFFSQFVSDNSYIGVRPCVIIRY